MPRTMRVEYHGKSANKSTMPTTPVPTSGLTHCLFRWIIERTFGWFMKHRRLVRHYEVKTAHAEAWLHIRMSGIMLRRLA